MTDDEPSNEYLLGLLNTQQETIDYLVQYVERIESRLNDRFDALEKKATPSRWPDGQPHAIRWEALSGEQRRAAWEEVDAFVSELVLRHGMAQHIRPCWWRHGAAVEELTALFTARNVAFAGDADASMPSWWEDLLERVQRRVRLTLNKCRDGHVEPETDGAWQTEEDRRQFLDFIEREAAEGEPAEAPQSSRPARRIL